MHPTRELGITRERVRQLERDAFEQLAGELENAVAADADELAGAAQRLKLPPCRPAPGSP